MTSKRPSWGTTSNFRRSTERRINENSIVYKYNIKVKNVMFINYIEFPSIIRSVDRRNFEVVPQDGRFDVSARGLLSFCPLLLWSMAAFDVLLRTIILWNKCDAACVASVKQDKTISITWLLCAFLLVVDRDLLKDTQMVSNPGQITLADLFFFFHAPKILQ